MKPVICSAVFHMNKGRKSSYLLKSNEWHCTCAICARVFKVIREKIMLVQYEFLQVCTKIILVQYIHEFLKLFITENVC